MMNSVQVVAVILIVALITDCFFSCKSDLSTAGKRLFVYIHLVLILLISVVFLVFAGQAYAIYVDREIGENIEGVLESLKGMCVDDGHYGPLSEQMADVGPSLEDNLMIVEGIQSLGALGIVMVLIQICLLCCFRGKDEEDGAGGLSKGPPV